MSVSYIFPRNRDYTSEKTNIFLEVVMCLDLIEKYT